MKVKDRDIVRQFHGNPNKFRLALLCGPNTTRCHALTDELAKPLIQDAERVDLNVGDLLENPARLNDEANSASLFGDKRFVMVRLNSGEATRAAKSIENVLESGSKGDPIFISAPGMTDKTALAKTIASATDALIATCYEISQGDAISAIIAMASEEGLQLNRNLSGEIAAMTGNDLSLARLEIEKIALYLDANPDSAQLVDPEILSRLGAANDEEDLGILYNAALNGNTRILTKELAVVSTTGFSEIGLIRLLLRHLGKLSELRTKADKGSAIDSIINHPSVFWKDRNNLAQQLRIWSTQNISRLIERILALEIDLKSSGQPEHILIEQELLTIARKAARLK